MYLRTLLHALRQGVALDKGGPLASAASATTPVSTAGVVEGLDASSSVLTSENSCAGSVPDRLLDVYLSLEDSISLTSKVLDVYAAYVGKGEVRLMFSRSQQSGSSRDCEVLSTPSTRQHTRSQSTHHDMMTATGTKLVSVSSMHEI